MRAHQIMTKHVIGVSPHTSILEAANIMLRCHVSGLPVLDEDGTLRGMVSEGDFLQRAEIGTGRKRSAWLELFTGVGRAATDFVHERGREVEDVMTTNPITVEEQTPLDEIVHLMQKHGVKRLPVVNDKTMVGIVTRADILQAVASMARDVPDPTADDSHIRDRIVRDISATAWRPAGFQVWVRNGVVHLYGLIFDERARQAAIVLAENMSGVKEVHDHLCFVDGYSGYYVESPEDIKAAG
ncbi:CBS domain-containing protein [Bradyrhizobium lablabi]|uniref:CBS domain-containing protein n=1 Tax=Bradyrhizobium lablabi TaxID=722472 RepID=UPI001BAA79EE|nr:CBS domain-containing protein [Bradyrhizobium lablabi]MBR0697850.1 CBS domain-containing protein [Bradyrhizobium lablabi]